MSLVELVGLLKGYAYRGKATEYKANVVLVNNTLKNDDVTVPGNKEWVVLGGHIYNGDNVARNCNVICYDSAGVELETLHADAALGATTAIQFPRNNQAAAECPMDQPVILEAGGYVRYQFKAGGASAGGTGRRFLRVLERTTPIV